jgi:hypothetical protein
MGISRSPTACARIARPLVAAQSAQAVRLRHIAEPPRPAMLSLFLLFRTLDRLRSERENSPLEGALVEAVPPVSAS